MTTGYTGEILVVNLTTGDIRKERIPEQWYRDFIGGAGLGVRLLYERMPAKADPIGNRNILGFMPGLMGGTNVPGSGRLTIVAKSPLTGGWGETNIGGHLAYEIKRAGYDGILIQGISPRPVYLVIRPGNSELRDASHLWGKETRETEELVRKETGEPRIRVACIGPAGELKSLSAAIISDATVDSRAAARSGLAAVMGSKRLKAIAVKGERKVPVAHKDRVEALAKRVVQSVRSDEPSAIKVLRDAGTVGLTHLMMVSGDAPIKNWTLIGPENFPGYQPYEDTMNKYVARKTACSSCPVGCGAILRADELGVGEIDRPEYETVAGFGPNCMNIDVVSILKLNDLCNRYGIDTIAVSNSIAFAMECYEKGIITKKDTGSVDLTWGNSSGMLALAEQIAKREGFGAIFADGEQRAAEQIGKGALGSAMTVGGQELAYHDPRTCPSRGTGYFCDPTPGRHTTFFTARVLEGGTLPGPYPEFWGPQPELRDYAHRSEMYGKCAKYEQVYASAGMCKFLLFHKFPFVEFFSAVTGWDIDLQEIATTGERIQTLRQMFTIREGIEPSDFRLPERVSRVATMGPIKDVDQDFELLRRQYYTGMGWNTETGHPVETRIHELGLRW